MNARHSACLLALSIGLAIVACGSDPAGTVGADSDAIQGADLPQGCSSAQATCEGNVAVTCVDGLAQRQDCGTDAYCNYGECVDTTIVLPRDAASHTDQSEWWYYTGHLKDGDHLWGFEITIFRYDLMPTFQMDGIGFMCHVAVTDVTALDHFHTDSISLDPQNWTSDPVVLEVDNCRFEEGGDGNDHIIGQIPAGTEKDGKATPWTLDLTVSPQKRVVRHGIDGIIPMGNTGKSSWYYSFTRLAAQGTLSTPTGEHAVTGQAWMDHQWGGFDNNEYRGWDWWSIQTEDKWEIMLFQFTSWEGVLVGKAGTIIDPDGNLTPLEGLDSFQITPRRTWASPHTDGVYPMDWDITIPPGDWNIAVVTAVDDQEMYNPFQNYWEGQTTVTGTRGGTVVTGVGYTELTGYATDAFDPKH